MTKQEIISELDRIGQDRQWLAEATGYTYDYVKNSLAPSAAEPSVKFSSLVRRAISEEERRKDVDTVAPTASIWDLVFFSGRELNTIDRAKKAGGYSDLPALYRDAVMAFADKLLTQESEAPANVTPLVSAYWIDLNGGIAAGSQTGSDVQEEPIPAPKQFPPDHYALRVFGRSMEPKIRDGATIIVKSWIGRGFPRKGTIVVYSDRNGRSLKEFGFRPAKGDEEHDAMGNVPVLRSLNKSFPDAEIIEGGRIEAIYVETL